MPLSWEFSREWLRKAINIIFNWAQKNAMFWKGGGLGDETHYTIVAKRCLAQTNYCSANLFKIIMKILWFCKNIGFSQGLKWLSGMQDWC